MEDKQRSIIILGLSIITLIFSIASIYTPWWRITTTKEKEIMSNGTVIFGEYRLTQTIYATRVSPAENTTVLVTVPLNDMPAEQEDKNAFGSLCYITLMLVIIASTLNAASTSLIFISRKQKSPYIKFARYTAVAASVLLLAATIYFASESQPKLSKFTSVLPQEVCKIPGEKIGSFWGGIEMSSGFCEWVWGPASGWYLAFTAFLLNAFTSSLITKISPKGKDASHVKPYILSSPTC